LAIEPHVTENLASQESFCRTTTGQSRVFIGYGLGVFVQIEPTEAPIYPAFPSNG
jgi:hypothetical protein